MLLVQLWTSDVSAIAAALAKGGFEPTFQRVDFEAALHAALARGGFDIVLVDRDTPGMTLELVRQGCVVYGIEIPIVVIESLDALADEVRRTIVPLRN